MATAWCQRTAVDDTFVEVVSLFARPMNLMISDLAPTNSRWVQEVLKIMSFDAINSSLLCNVLYGKPGDSSVKHSSRAKVNLELLWLVNRLLPGNRQARSRAVEKAGRVSTCCRASLLARLCTCPLLLTAASLSFCAASVAS